MTSAEWMDAAQAVAARFERIIDDCDWRGRPSELSHSDKVIYYIVSVRCETDMNGFQSVFEQLLDHTELAFFVRALRELGCAALADTYEQIGTVLQAAGYYPSRRQRLADLPAESGQAFATLEQRATQGDPLWDLDEKLAALPE